MEDASNAYAPDDESSAAAGCGYTAPRPAQDPDAGRRASRQALIDARVLYPSAVEGIYGRSGLFESIADGLNTAISKLGADQHAEVMRFPPAMPRKDFEASEYLKSFPQLAGTVHCFCGSDSDHRRLLARLERGEDWADQQRPTDVVLAPAACYPVYPVIAARGPMSADGMVVDVLTYCFRQRAVDRPGTHADVPSARDTCGSVQPSRSLRSGRYGWSAAGSLPACWSCLMRVDLANDPFFGRGGKIVADSQRELKLKFELLVPINDGAPPTACMSFNYHMDHFAHAWPLRTADGEPAHTGCVGFGIERLTLALLRHHGFDLAKWPRRVRDVLGASDPARWRSHDAAEFPGDGPRARRAGCAGPRPGIAVNSAALDGEWSWVQTAAGAAKHPCELQPDAGWLPAPVPGTVASALRAAGRWDDAAPPSLHAHDHWYRAAFSGLGRRVLRFNGLATIAEVWLNASLVLSTRHMFVAHEVDVDLVGDNCCTSAFAPLSRGCASSRARFDGSHG
ncbi:amino acid--[acyl-carrier-protein] ligase [Cupriavidus basilensis]